MNDWIQKNYTQMKKMCDKFSIEIDTDDLCQSCIEQLLKNKKAKDIPENKLMFFFTRIVMNNAKSTTSNFYTENRKYKFSEINNLEVKDVEYVEGVDYDWVLEQIKELKKTQWYYARLFELWIEEGCSQTKLSKRTTIPINSISRDLKKFRDILKQKRKEHYGL